MGYNIIIIDDVLDGYASGDNDYYSDNKHSSTPKARERRDMYDKLISCLGEDITIKYFGNASTPESFENHAQKSKCDLIILDEDLSSMGDSFKEEEGSIDSVRVAKDILNRLKRLNDDFYDKHKKLPPIIRITGRDSEQTLTVKSFVSLQRRLSTMFQELNCDHSPTFFFNVMLRRNDAGDYRVLTEGFSFKDMAVLKMKAFNNYRISATQPAVLITYVNEKEKNGIIKSLTNYGYKKSNFLSVDLFTDRSQSVIFEKWELIEDGKRLAIYLLDAGPGVGAFLKKTLSFLIFKKTIPVTIGCIICTGVAFSAKDVGNLNVVISKVIIDADYERYEDVNTIPAGSRVIIENALKNAFSEAAREITGVEADDVEVASADKLYKSAGAVIELTNRYPTAKVGEMEARGLIHLTFGVNPLVKYGIMVKGISDKGDSEKNDELQSATAEKAANVILKTISKEEFIKNYLS